MKTESSPETSDPRAIATAWALGELTPEERTTFEAQIANDPDLAALAEETKEFCGLLTGTLAGPALELPEASRSLLVLEGERPRTGTNTVGSKWVRRVTTLAACVAAGGMAAYWYGSNLKYSYQSTKGRVAVETASGNEAPPANPTLPVSLSSSGPRYSANKDALDSYSSRGGQEQDLAQNRAGREGQIDGSQTIETLRSRISSAQPPSDAETPVDVAKTPVTGPGAPLLQGRVVNGGTTSLNTTGTDDGKSSGIANGVQTPQTFGGGGELYASDSVTPASGLSIPDLSKDLRKEAGASPLNLAQAPPMSGPRGLGSAAGVGQGTGKATSDFSTGGLLSASSAPAKAGEFFETTGTENLSETTRGRYFREAAPPADEAKDSLLTGRSPNTESYQQVQENPFRPVSKEPVSTFSTDVDTASYANVRRFLNMGQCPPPAAVRLEELVNYFPYDYAPPQDGKPFAVHVEMTSAPWDASHRLARIALKGKEIAQGERPAANLVFLVDVSGSMTDENKLPLVRKSLKFVVDRLTEKDTVSLVTYAGESGVVLPATNGGERQRIQAAIDGLRPGGSTNGAGGITMAYEQASKHFNREGINRVILATDGDFNVGVTSNEDLLRLITEKAKTGTFLSVLGYGMGNTKDDRMELLADKGNGNYAYIDSLSEARKTLGDQFNGTLVTIAKDVKVQIEFNPSLVRSYRLLGYENRMLAKEDFLDDKKDAGEIGAGHTVTALYEIIPAGAPDPAVKAGQKLKYQPQAEPVAAPPPVPVDTTGETMTVFLRWKAPDAEVSQGMDVPVKDGGEKIATASPETRWAVAVAGFASLLNNSRHSGLSWEDVRALARSSKGTDPNGYRGEFLQLVDKAATVRPH